MAPRSRVVYVDYDPVVLAHARALLTSREAGATARLNQLSRPHFTLRDHAQVLRFFEGLELLEPGVVRVEKWRASELETRDQSAMWGGVGRRP